MNFDLLIPLIPALPLAGFLVTAAIGRRLGARAHWIPVLAVVASWAIAMIVVYTALTDGAPFGADRAYGAADLLREQPGVDVAGVGYRVAIPVSTFYRLGEEGTEVSLRVHTHVREDALALFGFLTAHEQDLFERQLRAGLARGSVDRGEPAGGYPDLASGRLDDCVHNRHLCKGNSVQPKGFDCKGLQLG